MKKYLSYKGFTLIELLVVITLIAILAVAILAAINPVEQRNKALDTGVQSAATQTVAAMERFYTTYGCWPDDSTISAAGIVTCPGGGTPALADIDKLVTVGEIKDAKIKAQLTGAGGIVVVDGNNIAHACFVPVSKAVKGKAAFAATATSVSAGTAVYCVPDATN